MKIKLNSLIEKIYEKLLEDRAGLTSQNIVKEFMKIENIAPQIAEKIIAPVLSNDNRFTRTVDGLWRAKQDVSIERLPLSEIEFIIFFIQEIKGMDSTHTFKINIVEKTRGVEYHDNYLSFILYRGGYTEEINDINNIILNINRYVFIPYDINSLILFKRIYREKFYISPEILTISVKSLVKNLYPHKKLKKWSDLIREFSIINVESNTAKSKTKTLLYVFEHLLTELEKKEIDNLEKLLDFINKNKNIIDFSRYSFDKDFLSNIPEYPGVYIFYNREGRVIYVGKTNNLRRRINSYFWTIGESEEKIRGILKDIFRIEYRVMGSELEAIVEEFNLIKKFTPRYNTQINIPERTIETPSRILLLPSAKSKDTITLFFLSNGLPLIKDEFNCKNPEKIIEKIRNIFNSRGYKFDPLKLLVISYLKRYGDNINIIEVENYSGEKAILNSLMDHCREIHTLVKEKKEYYQE